MAPLRLVFMGTADLSCPILEAVMGVPDFQVVAVVTQPDRARGRDMNVRPTPVKELALRGGLPVLQPERARDPGFITSLRELRPDLAAVAAYGQILSPELLELPTHGCLNVHTSLLPKYRGAAPIQWAIMNGETETGVTIMKMDKGLDTGDIVTRESTQILDGDNSQTLHGRLAGMGASLLVRTIPLYVNGVLKPQPQPTEGVSYAPKIKKQDGLIDWNLAARTIWNRLRAFVPWPGLFTMLPSPSSPLLMKIWEAIPLEDHGAPGVVIRVNREEIVVGCGVGALKITRLQLEGGRRLSAREFLAGHPLKEGAHISPQ